MTKLFRKISLLSLVLLLLACSIGGAVIAFANTQPPLVSEVVYEQTYDMNDVLEIKKGSITFNNTQKQANSYIIFPDGQAYRKDKVVLGVEGKYTIRYFADFNGRRVYEDKEFYVNPPLYSVSSSSASATYKKEMGGVEVKIPSGSYFNYNNILDFNTISADSPFISFYVQASETGYQDFGVVVVKLTDYKDPNNFIFIRVHNADRFEQKDVYPYAKYTSYVGANMTGIASGYTGLDANGKTIHKGDRFGRSVRFSYSNEGFDGAKPINDQCMLYLNYETKELFAYSTAETNYGGFVCDLDDVTYFNEPFKGFTDGKCYVSITGRNYDHSDTGTIVVTNVKGDDLSKAVATDNEKPKIAVDYDGYQSTKMPEGVVNCEYSVLDFYATDNRFIKQQNVQVFYNYYSPNKISIEIVDNKFTPKWAGAYYIVYSAEDTFGNKGEEVIKINVFDSAESLISYDVDEYAQTAIIGHEMTINKPFNLANNEKYGRVSITIKAKHEQEEVVIADRIDVEKLNSSNFSFMPMKNGKWSIEYVVDNFSGQSTIVTKEFNVISDGVPVFLENITTQLPHYLLNGQPNVLPTLYAHVFGEQTVEKFQAQIKTNYKSSETVLDGNVIIPQVDNSGDVIELTYFYLGTKVTYSIPVIKVNNNGEIDLGKLFVKTNGNPNATFEEDGIKYTANDDFSLEYVSKPFNTGFHFEFALLDYNFEQFDVVLTDAVNIDKSVTISFVNNSGLLKLIYCGKIVELSSTRIILDYDNYSGTITVNGRDYKISETDTAELFNGFEGSYLYFTTSLITEKTTQIKYVNIANQPLGANNIDVIKPIITILGDYSLDYEKGKQATIHKAIGFDVIDGLKDVFVSVKSGSKYVEADGVVLNNVKADKNYQIDLTKYGTYSIVYTCTDSSNNSRAVRKSIIILDDVPPTIEVVGNVRLDYSFGSGFIKNSVVVSDNQSDEEYIITNVVLISPNGKYVVWKDSFTFDVRGEWIARYYAVDEEGNMALIDYKIKVA